MSAALHFVDDERHLLGSGNKQGRQTNCGGIGFHGFSDDRFSRDLLAEVNDGIAVVRKNRLDEILANIMHIAVDGGDDDGSLGDAFHFLKIILEVRNGLLHRFSGLQHEGQDQFTRAELVTDFFHGGEQDVVQSMNSRFMPGREIAAINDLINICFDAIFDAVQDLPMQTLFRGHPCGGVCNRGLG